MVLYCSVVLWMEVGARGCYLFAYSTVLYFDVLCYTVLPGYIRLKVLTPVARYLYLVVDLTYIKNDKS
jgi:hypothetical protein